MIVISDSQDKKSKGSTFSIILAEPNSLLREKIAGVLTRQKGVWCVVQVNGRAELVRSAAKIQPDFILADITTLNHHQTIDSLRKSTEFSRILAMANSVSEPYQQVVEHLGIDGLIDKTEVAEYFLNQIQRLRQYEEVQREE